MTNTRNPNRPTNSIRDGPEVGAVRIRSKPTPDAQDRLRRLFTLLVRYATADGIIPQETHSHKADDEAADEK